MSEKSMFFPDVNGDRGYDNTDLANYIHSFISNGVYNLELSVAAGENMQIIVPAGRAWINGYYYRNDGNLALAVANADGVLKRKDTVVLRWDINTRNITAQVLTGAFASNPVAPAIVRGAEQYDLKLAEIEIPAGATAITQANITDTRLNTDVCGIVHAVVDHVDTSTLYQQIQSDLANFKSVNEDGFTQWMENLKSLLDENTAGHLQNEIEGKSDKSTAKIAVMTASGWSGAIAPYSQTLSIDGVTVTSANEVLPGTSITSDQLTALQAANLQDGGQAVGSITLLAYGDKPLIDIPIRVIIRGDL
jgi:hypothetical protein